MSDQYPATLWISDGDTANTAVLEHGAGGSNFTSDVEVAWWHGRAIEKLAELSRLPENWDSYGAARPNVRLAIDLGNALYVISRAFPDSDCPELFASPSGGFVAEWTSSFGEFSLNVEPGEKPEAWLSPKDSESEFAEFSKRNCDPMLEAAKRFFA